MGGKKARWLIKNACAARVCVGLPSRVGSPSIMGLAGWHGDDEQAPMPATNTRAM